MPWVFGPSERAADNRRNQKMHRGCMTNCILLGRVCSRKTIQIDRDLEEATRCAKECRARWSSMQALVSPKEAPGADACQHDALMLVQTEYLEWLKKLCTELEAQGEPDFDGLLRNGVNFLEESGEKITY